ncbi:CoxG family protein [Bacillota bacterium Lsc_1132]
MPSGMHQVELNLPIEVVWKFVKDMDHWAPLVPGYIQHEKINESQSTWEFYGDLGMMKKKIRMMVTIKEWFEPTKVTFDLKGLNENFAGSGYFEAEKISDSRTRMTGYLNIEAEGIMAKMINGILKTSIPSMAEKLTAAIAEKIT